MSKVTLVAQPQEFFRELVVDALGNQKLSATPETEFYLVNLLFQFMVTDRLYVQDSQGHLKEEPLAFMLKEAVEQPTVDARRNMYRLIGDKSLYVAGFFQESLTRKLVDIDYYIELGGAAYQNTGSLTEETAMRAVYGELSEKFKYFVDVLTEVSDRTTTRTEKDILRLYDSWMRTKSERAAKALKEEGILPESMIAGSKKGSLQ